MTPIVDRCAETFPKMSARPYLPQFCLASLCFRTYFKPIMASYSRITA